MGAQFFSVTWPKFHVIKDEVLHTGYLRQL